MIANAYKSDATVGPGGRVELNVPLPPGTTVEVIVVVSEIEEFDDLVAAANSTTDFWNNSLDDEDWNAPKPS